MYVIASEFALEPSLYLDGNGRWVDLAQAQKFASHSEASAFAHASGIGYLCSVECIW